MKITIEIEKPTKCGECPFYEDSPYTCHNEVGEEPHCRMGYMKDDHRDMRDMSFKNKLYERCKLGL